MYHSIDAYYFDISMCKIHLLQYNYVLVFAYCHVYIIQLTPIIMIQVGAYLSKIQLEYQQYGSRNIVVPYFVGNLYIYYICIIYI